MTAKRLSRGTTPLIEGSRPPMTVIMPARNAARTIRLAVASTLKDLGPSDGLIVLDDGSTDRTTHILRTLSDPRLRVIYRTSAGGVTVALNTLLDEVRTPLTARMDADDVVIPGRFSRQRQHLARGADVVFTSRVNFGNSPLSFVPAPLLGLSPTELSLLHVLTNPVPHPSMLAHTATLHDAGGYRPGPAEDYELWMRLHAAGARLECDARPGILYRMHKAQVSRQPVWLDSLKDDPALEASHTALLRHLGWQGPACWTALRTVPLDPARRKQVGELKQFLMDLAHSCGGRTRRLLHREFAKLGV